MIENLIFVILFLKIFFRAFNFIPYVLVNIIRVFFISECVAENLKANKNQPKRSLILQYSFAQKTSLILRIWTLLKLKKTCSQNTAKKLSQFTNCPANMFLFGVSKIIFTTPFPDDQELLSWSTLKANVSIFLFISIAFCFKDVARFYLVVWRKGKGGGGVGENWIISLRRLAVWVS